MPCIAHVGGIRIDMYHRDHNPPHFHAIQADDEARFRISDLGLLPGSTLSSAAEQAVRAWASNHQAALALNWIFAIAAMPLRNIP
jgi:hypothetical protein